MLGAPSRHEFDLVLFWSLDRFSREGVLPTLKHLELLTSYGVMWKSYTEQYFDSCGILRDAVISIAAMLAKQERLKISGRTIAGLQRAKRQGRVGGRPRVVVDRGRVLKMRDGRVSGGHRSGTEPLQDDRCAHRSALDSRLEDLGGLRDHKRIRRLNEHADGLQDFTHREILYYRACVRFGGMDNIMS
jgi:resolvase-like protein